MHGWPRITIAGAVAVLGGCDFTPDDVPQTSLPAPRRVMWVYPWTFITSGGYKVWDPHKLDVQAQITAIEVWEFQCNISDRTSTFFDEAGFATEGFDRNGNSVYMGDNFYGGNESTPIQDPERQNWQRVGLLTADRRGKLRGRGFGVNVFYTERITVSFGQEPPGMALRGLNYAVAVPHTSSDFPADSPYRLIAAHEIGHQLNLINSPEAGT